MQFLTDTELHELTGRVRHFAQIRALRAMGIEHLVRPDGRPLVLKAHIDHILAAGEASRTHEPTGPDWSALE